LSSTRKVLVLIKGLGLGGAERLLIDSLPFLDRDRFEYHVAYLLPWKNLLARECESAGVRVHSLGHVSWANHEAHRAAKAVALLPGAFGRLLALVRRERFDLIQADLPVAGLLARVAGRVAGVPVVYTEHNVQERYHRLTRWANAATYRWNQRAVAVSHEVASSMERGGLLTTTRVITLPNGVPVESVRSEAVSDVDMRDELGIPKTDLIVGTVAVFRTQKRLRDWLEVAAQVAAVRSDVTFLLVGAGPLDAEVRTHIQALGLAHRVRTPGFRRDGRRVMSVMDVFLMTSEFEGLPIALLEAMTLAKPIVSTAVGGVPEAIGSGTAGLLAPVGAIDMLSRHVLQLLDNATLRAQMGNEGAARVESHYHLKRRVEVIESLYDEVIQEAA